MRMNVASGSVFDMELRPSVLKPAVILAEFVTVLLQFPYLSLFLALPLSLLLVCGFRLGRECVFHRLSGCSESQG